MRYISFILVTIMLGFSSISFAESCLIPKYQPALYSEGYEFVFTGYIKKIHVGERVERIDLLVLKNHKGETHSGTYPVQQALRYIEGQSYVFFANRKEKYDISKCTFLSPPFSIEYILSQKGDENLMMAIDRWKLIGEMLEGLEHNGKKTGSTL